MNGAGIQAKIWRGYGIAAAKAGFPFTQYRPAGVGNPIVSGNSRGTISAALSAAPYKFVTANLYGKAVWYALVDGSLIQPADYLVGASGTYFIAGMQPLLPIVAVECNRVLSVVRPAQPAGLGALGYSGDEIATETPVMTAWPGSVLQGTKGEKGDVVLPGDVRMPWWNVLLPASPGVDILTTDIINDDHGRRYKVSSAELTDFGWRLTAMLAET